MEDSVYIIPSTLEQQPGQLWAIVLAAGAGRRTQPFVRERLGQNKPKQYCAFTGTRSMFQHTIDRISHLIPLDRIVVVSARHHQHDLYAQIERRPVGTILFRPETDDAADDVFLPMTYILARDPDATVAVFPADHFVYPEDALLDALERAVFASEFMVAQPILIGTMPDDPEVKHNGIQPGRFLGWTGKYPICAVERLLETSEQQKPGRTERAGGLCNTMILVTKGRRLWQWGCESFPELMSLFERLKTAIDTPEEPRVLDCLHAAMPMQDFSVNLLQSAPMHLAVMVTRDLVWSDWNDPARVERSLQHIGKYPAWAETASAP